MTDLAVAGGLDCCNCRLADWPNAPCMASIPSLLDAAGVFSPLLSLPATGCGMMLAAPVAGVAVTGCPVAVATSGAAPGERINLLGVNTADAGWDARWSRLRTAAMGSAAVPAAVELACGLAVPRWGGVLPPWFIQLAPTTCVVAARAGPAIACAPEVCAGANGAASPRFKILGAAGPVPTASMTASAWA